MIEFDLNGNKVSSESPADTPLLWVIRDELKLKGTKFGCGIAQCGACTVHLGDTPVRSCVLDVAAVGNREVTTIEGVEGRVAEAVQASWESGQVPQCGFCQSGQIMTAIALLEKIASPSDDDVDAALTGNVCRCAAYPRIRRAVHEAAARARS